jgi:phenylpyruvate tautomerase PptA (4-oxalocrotonate tautomerase family)
MPLVRLSFTPTHDATTQRYVADHVHDALVESVGIPPDDRFQLLRQSGEMIYDRSYLGIERTEKFVIVEIIFRAGRSVEKKQALYANIAGRLEGLGIPKGDVMIVLLENAPEDWSFGNGVAQYVK